MRALQVLGAPVVRLKPSILRAYALLWVGPKPTLHALDSGCHPLMVLMRALHESLGIKQKGVRVQEYPRQPI